MIGSLIALLSLDVTRKLVAAGMVAKTLTIVDATYATPIVVETSAAHGYTRPAHGVVSGVTGNEAANGLWVLTPVDTTHLTLTTFTSQGIPTNSEGDGAYVSGGEIEIAFPDGSILLGRRNIAMQTSVATPRIVFVPIGSPPWELDPYGGVIPTSAQPRSLAAETAEQKTMKLQRQLCTERQRFEVHVTGCANPPSPDFGDFDATQAIYQTLYGSMFELITPDRARVLSGEWVSQSTGIQVVDTRGQKWMGIVEIAQPVLPDPLEFVPSMTSGYLTVNFENGSSADQTVIIVT